MAGLFTITRKTLDKFVYKWAHNDMQVHSLGLTVTNHGSHGFGNNKSQLTVHRNTCTLSPVPIPVQNLG